MCLFPRKITDYKSASYQHGMREFECGVCPECLAKRARSWALRAVMESKNAPSMMICLTYDTEIRDRAGRVIGERVASDMHVDKRDCQLFIKRLRKHFGDQKIKYILTAEYGKTTGRPHYHAIIFGTVFDDLIFRKKSKRGNLIYSSPTLNKIWGHGICSVDSVNTTAAMARYCTKYAAKDGRSDDTFMLFSRGIGDFELLRQFNGKSYIVDGQEYPIPKQIWQKVISDRYAISLPKYRSRAWCFAKYSYEFRFVTVKSRDIFEGYKYVKCQSMLCDELYAYYANTRQLYQSYRDQDPQYQSYLAYWKRKIELLHKPNVIDRINMLDSQKYGVYKQRALHAYRNKALKLPLLPLKSERYAKERFDFVESVERGRYPLTSTQLAEFQSLQNLGHLPKTSRHLTANDTKTVDDGDILKINADENGVLYDEFIINSFKTTPKTIDNYM